MLSNYIKDTVRTTRLVVYWLKLPSQMEVSLLMLEDNAKQGLLNMTKSIFNEYGCSPMIRIVSDTKLDMLTAIQHQSVLYEYFDKYKYHSKGAQWYGREDAYVVDANDMAKAVKGLVNGYRPTEVYDIAGAGSELVF